MKDHSFLKGILFITALYPFVCGMVALFEQTVDYICTRIAAATAKIIEENSGPPQSEPISAIGFQYSTLEDEDEDN